MRQASNRETIEFGVNADICVAETLSRIFLRHGVLAGGLSILLALFGNPYMQMTIVAGVVLAYWILRKQRAHPFRRLLSRTGGAPSGHGRGEDSRAGPPGYEKRLRRIALIWGALLIAVSAVSVLVPMFQVSIFNGPDLMLRITKAATVATLIFSQMARAHGSVAPHYFILSFRILDYVVLILLSLVVSMTGSACLYWFFLGTRTSPYPRHPNEGH